MNGECPTCLVTIALGGVANHTDGLARSGPAPDELATWFTEYSEFELLGQGGMGVVYRARHSQLDRMVAIKVLGQQFSGDPDFSERFLREARLLARLNHPNIVQVYDAGEIGGIPYLVMQLIEGCDLQTHVARHGPADVREAIGWIIEVAKGLEYAHQSGIVHRDIKPANLLLDHDGRVYVLDLGLARLNVASPESDSPHLTQATQVLGSTGFMSPEQATDSRSVDERSDIYSLGCTLYYLLTGQVPYQEDTAVKQILAHRDHPIPSLSEHGEDVPAELDDVYQSMIAKLPEQRPQNVTQVIDKLTGVLDCSDGSSSRNRSTAGTVLTCFLIAATGLLAGLVYWIKTDRGTVRVEIEQAFADEVEAKLQEGGLTVTDKDGDQTWHIAPGVPQSIPSGDFRLQPIAGLQLSVRNQAGVELSTDSFAIRRSGEIVLRASLARDDALRQSGRPADQPSRVHEPITAGSRESPLFVDVGQRLGNVYTTALPVADVDGDGDLDLVVCSYLHGPSQVWLNDGHGSFSAGALLSDERWSNAGLHDLNGDANVDLLATTRHGSNAVWFGDGTGGFADSGQKLGSTSSRDVAFGDLDGDGDPDAMICAGGTGALRPNFVLINDGTGHFEESEQALGKRASWAVALGDLDGDGDLDAVFANGEDPRRTGFEPATLWLNDGNGRFTESETALPTARHYDVDIGDLNGDDRPDIVLASKGYRNSVWVNRGSGQFVELQTNLTLAEGRSTRIADLDADGDNDIVFVNAPNQLLTLWNDGRGGFAERTTQDCGPDASTALGVGDFDTDSDLDIVVGQRAEHPNVVLINRSRD